MRWPWQKKPSTPEWARGVVASIPAEQLPNHILTFATSLSRTRNPQTRALHLAKIQAACERLERELSVAPVPSGVMCAGYTSDAEPVGEQLPRGGTALW